MCCDSRVRFLVCLRKVREGFRLRRPEVRISDVASGRLWGAGRMPSPRRTEEPEVGQGSAEKIASVYGLPATCRWTKCLRTRPDLGLLGVLASPCRLCPCRPSCNLPVLTSNLLGIHDSGFHRTCSLVWPSSNSIITCSSLGFLIVALVFDACEAGQGADVPAHQTT